MVSPDWASSPPVKAPQKGKGSDMLCIMGRGAASGFPSQLSKLQLEASPAVDAASRRAAGTVVSSTPSRSIGASMCAKLHASETRGMKEDVRSPLILIPIRGGRRG